MGDDEELVYPTKIPTPNYYHHNHALKVLEFLKDATHRFHTDSDSDSDSGTDSSTQLLLQLEELGMFLSADPRLSTLSSHLSQLRLLVQTQEESKSKHRIRSFLSNRIRAHEISQVSRLIESEIQAWIDRQNLEELGRILKEVDSSILSKWDEENLITKLSQLRERLGKGFDIDFQDSLLKSRIYFLLECLLTRASNSIRVREIAAYTLKELVLFNKDVFVGQVLVGQTIKSLIAMGSVCGLDVLKSLIKAIKSPLVDEIDSFGGILKIIEILSDHNQSNELGLRIMALDCIMEIGYYGRKEAIESMLEEAGLIKKLVDLQRSEWGGVLIEMEKGEEHDDNSSGGSSSNKMFLEKHPFASCVARFAVQLEVGEGLRQREKRAFKQEILKKVREACVSDAEAATIIAEVLWGSSP